MKRFLIVCIIAFTLWYVSVTPSNAREWSRDQAVLPYAEISENSATIYNIRNFTYESTTDYTPAYYNKAFNLDELVSVDYIVEPFAGIGAAHTFLSFGFKDGSYVAISAEIRKEKGEIFKPWKGLLKRYELMYVIADERDAIKLRTNYRKDPVYIYPVKTTEEKMRALFVDILLGANNLKDTPEFYNTITNNCARVIARHTNTVTPGRVPWWNISLIFPKHSDIFASELGLIEAPDGIEKAREKHIINDLAEKYADSPNFSQMIRSGR